MAPTADRCDGGRRFRRRFGALTLVGPFIALQLLPAATSAAVVSGISLDARGRAEVFLRLERGEQASRGQVLRSERRKRGWRVKVLQVVGRYARGALVAGARPRLGDVSSALRRVSDATTRPAWRLPGETLEGSTKQIGPGFAWTTEAVDWAAQRRKARTLVTARRGRRLRGDEGKTKGDLTLVGLTVVDLRGPQSWTFASFQSRLDVPSIAGTNLSWSHDLSLRYDGIGARDGAERAGARTLAVRRARLGWRATWGAVGVGRQVVQTGASGRLADGATARFYLGDWGSVVAWGGMAPDPVSLSPLFDTGRFGLGWAAWARRGSVTARWQVGWAAQTVEGKMDPHRFDLSVRVQHERRGHVDAAATIAVGRADLSGTPLSGITPPMATLSHLWIAAASERKSGWLGRLRYSYHRPIADRLWARDTPWQVWVDGQSHIVSVDAERGGSRGFWLRPTGHAVILAGPERYDGLRMGAALRVGHRGRRWSPHAAIHVESGLSFTDDGRAAGPSRTAGAWLGTAHDVTPSWRLSGRVGLRWDQALPIGNAAVRARTTSRLEWMKGRWIAALQVGNDTLLNADPSPDSYQLNWVDVALLLRRRL